MSYPDYKYWKQQAKEQADIKTSLAYPDTSTGAARQYRNRSYVFELLARMGLLNPTTGRV